MRPRTCSLLLVAILSTAACGKDDPGKTSGGAFTAGPVASHLGIGSYEIGIDPRQVIVKDAAGEALGVATIESDLDGDLSMRFEPATQGRGGTLEVAFDALEPSGPARLVLDLTLDGTSVTAPPMRLRVRVQGSHDPMGTDLPLGTWNTRAHFEAPLGLGAPGLGGLRLAEDGRWAVLETAGTSPASPADLRVWLEHVGAGGLMGTRTDDVLLGLLFDLGPLLDQVERAATPGGRAALSVETVDPCVELLGDEYQPERMRQLQATCTGEHTVGTCSTLRFECDAWVTGPGGMSMCVNEAPRSALFEAFTSEGCLWGHLECAVNAMRSNWCASLPSAEELDQHREDCGRRTICRGGLRGAPATIRGEGCTCVCTPGSCAEHCASVAAREGLTVSAPACVDDFTCDCGFEPEAICELEFPTTFCGDVEVDAVAVAVYCTTSLCGDGAFAASCTASPEGAEVCDASTLEGLRCEPGKECVGCACIPCESSVECGDGRISWTCPGLEEECDGEGQAQCPDGMACELCGCVATSDEPTCQDGTRPWTPAGQECGVTCAETVETPLGLWSDCVGERGRPGCDVAAPEVTIVDDDFYGRGYALQSCLWFSPTYTEQGGTCDTACAWQNKLELSPAWYDLGRAAPSVARADWEAELRNLCVADLTPYGASKEILWSATHWAAVCYAVPDAVGSAFAIERGQALLRSVETLAWPME